MFFWANRPVECIVLKKLLMNNKVCADLAMFFPIQPIYVARPLFRDGMTDPVKKRFVFLAGSEGRQRHRVIWNRRIVTREGCPLRNKHCETLGLFSVTFAMRLQVHGTM